VEKKLEFVEVYVFGTDGVSSKICTHQDAEAILADDTFIKNFSW
jgi:hypothetical protein